MTRVATTNYTGDPNTTFEYATLDTDAFDRDDVSKVARALEAHDHTAGKGLAVARIANNSVTTAMLQAGSVNSGILADLSVTNGKLAADSVTADKIAAGAVGASEIVDGGVGTNELANLAVTNAKMAVGTALANLGYTPVNKAGDTMTGPLTTTALTTGSLSTTLVSLIGVGVSVLEIGKSDGTSPSIIDLHGNAVDSDYAVRISVGGGGLGTGFLHITTGGIVVNSLYTVWHSGNDGTGSGLDADTLRTLVPGNGNGNIPISNGVVNTNLNAAMVAGKTPTATPGAGALPLADGSGKLDSWVTAAVGVPSGVIAAFQTAASIPAGWTRYANLDGRIPIGAGTTFAATFLEANNYGSGWVYTPAGGVTVVVGSASPVTNNVNLAFGGAEQVTPDHGHSITSQTFTGTPANTWDKMALHAVVWAKKN